MSLMRQLWLGVMLIAVLALTGSFFISLWSARHYLQDQLYLKNQDNATALALLLSQQSGDAVTQELFIAAQFDSGHYQLIRFIDSSGRILIERRQDGFSRDVPVWFQKAIPLAVAPGFAQVSQGWKQSGSITVLSHSRFAYRSLWRGCLELALWFAAGAAFVGIVGTFWLRRIHRPLQAVVGQAQAIQERRFIAIAEPDIPEFRSVARAMNSAVTRLRAMFEEEAARLETLRREANHDALTGLANRGCFLAEFEQNLHDRKSAPRGVLILLRVAGLAEMNRRYGRHEADRLLTDIGNALKRLAVRQDNLVLGRMNGSDFAVLSPAELDGAELAQLVLEVSLAAAADYDTAVVQIASGWTAYQHGQFANELLASVDAALARAETQSLPLAGATTANTYLAQLRSMAEWHALFDKALETRAFKLVSYPVLALDGTLLHREALLRLSPEEGVWLSAAEFMPMAHRLKRSADLDYLALELALEALEEGAEPYSVNIDGSSLDQAGFIYRVEQLLRRHGAAVSRLWLEVSEASALSQTEALSDWCVRLGSLGVHLGIEHFGDKLSGITQLHRLGLSYLKVDGRFIQNIDQRAGNEAFVRGLVNMGHAMGVLVIAEGVHRDAEWDAVKTLGFDGATGPGVRGV